MNLHNPKAAIFAFSEHVHLSVENEATFAQAAQLHGGPFRAIAAAEGLVHLHDAALRDRMNECEIVLVADKRGQWTFHYCRLSHTFPG